MKDLTRLFVCLALVTTAQTVCAQIVPLSGTSNSVLREKDYISVDGSPYFFKDWRMGGIRTRNGASSENVLVRYDTYRDEVQFMQNERALVVDSKDVKEFYFLFKGENNSSITHYTFKNGFQVEGFLATAFFQVIYESDVAKLLRRTKTDYVEEEGKAFGTNEVIRRFVRTTGDYLIIGSNSYKLEKNRKDIFEHFGNFADPLKKFAKESKLNLKDDKDMVDLLEKYKTLAAAQ